MIVYWEVVVKREKGERQDVGCSTIPALDYPPGTLSQQTATAAIPKTRIFEIEDSEDEDNDLSDS